MSTSHRAKRESILGRKSFQSLPAGTQRPDAHAMPALYNACEMVAAWSMPGPAPCASVPLRVPVAYEMQTLGYHVGHGLSISDWITRWTSFDCFVVMPGASAARRDTAIGSIRTLAVGVPSVSPEGEDACECAWPNVGNGGVGYIAGWVRLGWFSASATVLLRRLVRFRLHGARVRVIT